MASKLLLITAAVATATYAWSVFQRHNKKADPIATKEAGEIFNNNHNNNDNNKPAQSKLQPWTLEDGEVWVTVLPRRCPKPNCPACKPLKEVPSVNTHRDQAPAAAPAPSSPKPKQDAPTNLTILSAVPVALNNVDAQPVHLAAATNQPLTSDSLTTPHLSVPVAALASALVPVVNELANASANIKPALAVPSPAPLVSAVPFTTRLALEMGVFGDLLVMGGTSTRQLAATWHRLPFKPFYEALPKVALAGAVMGDVVEYTFGYEYDSNGGSTWFTLIAHHWVPAWTEDDPEVSYKQDLKTAMAAAVAYAAA